MYIFNQVVLHFAGKSLENFHIQPEAPAVSVPQPVSPIIFPPDHVLVEVLPVLPLSVGPTIPSSSSHSSAASSQNPSSSSSSSSRSSSLLEIHNAGLSYNGNETSLVKILFPTLMDFGYLPPP